MKFLWMRRRTERGFTDRGQENVRVRNRRARSARRRADVRSERFGPERDRVMLRPRVSSVPEASERDDRGPYVDPASEGFPSSSRVEFTARKHPDPDWSRNSRGGRAPNRSCLIPQNSAIEASSVLDGACSHQVPGFSAGRRRGRARGIRRIARAAPEGAGQPEDRVARSASGDAGMSRGARRTSRTSCFTAGSRG